MASLHALSIGLPSVNRHRTANGLSPLTLAEYAQAFEAAQDSARSDYRMPTGNSAHTTDVG